MRVLPARRSLRLSSEASSVSGSPTVALGRHSQFVVLAAADDLEPTSMTARCILRATHRHFQWLSLVLITAARDVPGNNSAAHSKARTRTLTHS
jgi:hypothetical protein